MPVVEKKGEEYRPDPVSIRQDFKEMAHRLRYYGYCWCDADCAASFGMGMLVPFYVIEVSIKKAKRVVFHKAEDGCYYVRKHGTTEMYYQGEVDDMIKQLAI